MERGVSTGAGAAAGSTQRRTPSVVAHGVRAACAAWRRRQGCSSGTAAAARTRVSRYFGSYFLAATKES